MSLVLKPDDGKEVGEGASEAGVRRILDRIEDRCLDLRAVVVGSFTGRIVVVEEPEEVSFVLVKPKRGSWLTGWRRSCGWSCVHCGWVRYTDKFTS